MFTEVGEFIDASEFLHAACDVCAGAFVGGIECGSNGTGFHGCSEATVGFNLCEHCPGFVGEFVGEVFNEEGASGGVDNEAEVGFFQKQQVGVAGNAGCESA